MAVTTIEREAALRRALDIFSARVRTVRPGQWQAPTPCVEWDVRVLVNHVVVEQLWVPPLLRGATIADVGQRFDGDQLGDDPVGAWEQAASAARTAWEAPGAWDRTVALSFGPTRASEYASQLTADLLIHGWDLSRGIGAEDPDDPDLTRLVLDDLAPQAESWRVGGVFGRAVPVPDDASVFSRLLGIAGRDPQWKPPQA